MFWNATVLASSVAANRDHIREVHAEIRQTRNDAANSFVNGVRGLNAQIRALPSGHPPVDIRSNLLDHHRSQILDHIPHALMECLQIARHKIEVRHRVLPSPSWDDPRTAAPRRKPGLSGAAQTRARDAVRHVPPPYPARPVR